MLNRLMFVYFIQRKGFLDGDRDYLRNRLNRCRRKGQGQVLFLLPLFPAPTVPRRLRKRRRSGRRNWKNCSVDIPYLNGGMFDVHEWKSNATARTSRFPTRPSSASSITSNNTSGISTNARRAATTRINPDVLGYIFEKYINQKQMGAYYTKEDITEYISKNTVIPFLFDAAAAKCKVAFENPSGPTIWDLLRENPDRYIYAAVKKGV